MIYRFKTVCYEMPPGDEHLEALANNQGWVPWHMHKENHPPGCTYAKPWVVRYRKEIPCNS